MVDALDSGSSVRKNMEVRVLSRVPDDISIAFIEQLKGSLWMTERVRWLRLKRI